MTNERKRVGFGEEEGEGTSNTLVMMILLMMVMIVMVMIVMLVVMVMMVMVMKGPLQGQVEGCIRRDQRPPTSLVKRI